MKIRNVWLDTTTDERGEIVFIIKFYYTFRKEPIIWTIQDGAAVSDFIASLLELAKNVLGRNEE